MRIGIAARSDCIALLAAALASCAPQPSRTSSTDLEKIQHIVVIYAENRSFDNLYGLFPGANGIANATPEQYTQVDNDGKVLPHLPPVWKGKDADPAFPKDLPNRPFRIDSAPINLPLSVATRDLVHKFYQNQEQINGGRLDRYVAASDAGGLAMGYYDGSQLPLWKWAQEYTLADNFFTGAFGGSYLNHFWLVCACTPEDRDAAANLRAQLDGRFLKRKPESPASVLNGPPVFTLDGDVTSDGWSVNTMQPPYQPSRIAPSKGGDPQLADISKHPLPPQSAKTIGDTLSARGISWAWYAGAWDLALRDGTQDPAAPRKIIYTNGAEKDHLHQRERRAVFRGASPAVQLFRTLRARHRRSQRAHQGLHRAGRKHWPRRVATGRVLQATRQPQRARRLHRCPVGRYSYRRADRQHQGKPALVIDCDHRDL